MTKNCLELQKQADTVEKRLKNCLAASGQGQTDVQISTDVGKGAKTEVITERQTYAVEEVLRELWLKNEWQTDKGRIKD